MEGWLRSWGEPATPPEGHGGHGDREMPGMMSDADMRRLMESTGTEFDLVFVEMMAAHHQGAIHMASYAADHADDDDVRRIAARIEHNQRLEIEELEAAAARTGLG